MVCFLVYIYKENPMKDNIEFTEIKDDIDIVCLHEIKRQNKYPFNKMEIGDSVFFKGQKTGGKAYIASQSHGRYSNKQFTGKTTNGGLVIIRVK